MARLGDRTYYRTYYYGAGKLSMAGSGTDYPEIRMMDPEQYEQVKKDAIKKLAGLPNVDAEIFRDVTEALGLDEDITWKPKLTLITSP